MKRILMAGSFAESLVNFRGPLLHEMVRCGNGVFAAAIEKFIVQPKLIQEMRAEGRKLVEKKFDVRMVNQVLLAAMELL